MNKVLLKEKEFNEYFNDFKFEIADPESFFYRINLRGILVDIAQGYINNHAWKSKGAISSIESGLKIEYLCGQQPISDNKMHLAYFETERHKIFMTAGMIGYIDQIYLDDKIVESARVELRKKDIFGSAGESLMGARYCFNSSEGFYNISKFINTILNSDMK